MRLIVTVIEAKDLPRANPRFKQVPYCVLQLEGWEKELRTQAVKSSSNPKWNESFSFRDVKKSSVLNITLTVMHKDRVISAIGFEMDVVAVSEAEGWYDLQAEDEQPGGKIHLALAIEKDPAEEEEEEEEEEEAAESMAHEEEEAAKSEPVKEEEEAAEESKSEENAEEEQTHIEEEEAIEDAASVKGFPVSPKSSRLARTIILKEKPEYAEKLTDEEIQERKDLVEEIRQKAIESAEQKYKQFLREKASVLVKNSKEVQKFKQEMSEASSVQNDSK